MSARVRLAIAALLLGGASGCNPVYAPPARFTHAGAPSRLPAGAAEFGITGLFSPAFAGGAHGAYGISDWIAVEGGGSAGGISGSQGRFNIMGWAGPRFSLPRQRDRRAQFIGDLELGLGAGYGGTNRGPAFGGYQGLGVGLGVSWFSLYLRGRIEESTGAGVPTTFWPSGMLGFGFDAGRDASLDVGFGMVGYVNRESDALSPFGHLGITWRFGEGKKGEGR